MKKDNEGVEKTGDTAPKKKKGHIPEWKQQIFDKVITKLDSLEEYEEKSDFIDLCDFYKYIDGMQSVWGVAPIDEKYIQYKRKFRKLYGSAGMVDVVLTLGIKEQGIDPSTVPLIPIMEYKLVPTGNVEYYDATLTPNQRRGRRYNRSDKGKAKRLREMAEEKEKKQRQKEEGFDD